MADYLASIFGTEKDKVNCSFFFKIGACRHGEHCSKLHNKPTFSQTLLLKNLYLSLENSSQKADKSGITDDISEERIQEHFDDTFEELFVELEKKYGEIEEMNICDNLSEHLAGKISFLSLYVDIHLFLILGNCYVKFRFEEDSEKAVTDLNNRWFDGRAVYAELSPVTDFHEACCRQYQMGYEIIIRIQTSEVFAEENVPKN
jgi:splicing factor U2AF subunit